MAAEWVERARAYLAGRSPRERRLLSVGGFVVLILLGYGAVYEPIRQARAKLTERLPALRAQLRLMKVQAMEIERLRGQSGDGSKGGLEHRVRSSAAVYGLNESIRQFVPVAGDQIQLVTQPLPAGTWIDWLADLERHGITVARCRITPGDAAGLASLELTLTGARR